MNDSPWHTLKYLCNYATYRFGLELSLFAALCLIMFRMDAISLAHALVVLVCLLLPRHHVRRFWKLYRVFASISVIWLYLNSLGMIDRSMTLALRYRNEYRSSAGALFETYLRPLD